MDSRIISNLLHGRKSLKNPLLVVKSQDFQKCEKWPFFKHFAKPIYSEAKWSKMADFEDEIDIT